MPEIWSELAIVEEADEINPPDRVARFVADKLPDVVRLLENVPKPADNPASVDVPEISRLPRLKRFPENVPKPADNPDKLEVPVTPKVLADIPPVKVEVEVLVTIKLVTVVVPPEIVEEACKTPAICNGPATVDEAEEIKPPSTVSIPVVEALLKVIVPATFNVPVAVIFATFKLPEIKAFPWTARSDPGVEVPMPKLL